MTIQGRVGSVSPGLTVPITTLYEEYEDNPGIALGTRLEDNQSNVFRFVKDNGTGIAVGLLVSPGLAALDIDASDPLISITNFDGTDANDPIIEFAAASTDMTVNAYAGGYLLLEADTGAGQMRKIVSNTIDRIVLEEPLITAVAADSTGRAVPNPYDDIKLSTASGSSWSHIMGVTIMALTADYYGWIQTRGWALLKDTATPAIGLPVIQGTTAGNSLELAENTFGTIVGTAIYTSATNANYYMAYINCE